MPIKDIVETVILSASDFRSMAAPRHQHFLTLTALLITRKSIGEVSDHLVNDSVSLHRKLEYPNQAVIVVQSERKMVPGKSRSSKGAGLGMHLRTYSEVSCSVATAIDTLCSGEGISR
jgi:hypothetical protein